MTKREWNKKMSALVEKDMVLYRKGETLSKEDKKEMKKLVAYGESQGWAW